MSAGLTTLASRINKRHRANEAKAGELRDGILSVGRMLLEAKAQVDHGGWRTWIEANCVFGEREAQRYMKVARELPETDTCVGFDSLRGALRELEPPGPTDEQHEARLRAEERELLEKGLESLAEILDALRTVRDRGLWRTSHSSFLDWCIGIHGIRGAAVAQLLEVPGRFTEVGWIPPDEGMSFEEWERGLAIVADISRAFPGWATDDLVAA